jgi:hypothetical protein
MIPLPSRYSKNGYSFTLVERVDNVAIYRQVDPQTTAIVAYEVFRVQKRPDKNIKGRLILSRETPPSNEQWGILGFTVRSISAAKERSTLLLQIDETSKKGKRQANISV